MNIIPAINAQTFEEVQKKIKLVEPYVSWAHLDIADGTFTKNTLWHNSADLDLLETSLNFEVHLMISEPEKMIMDWIKKGVKRIIFHISASSDPDFAINVCRRAGVEAGISVGPDESVAKALSYQNKVKFFQILGVRPGLPGQKTDENTFERIKEVRKFCLSCIIEVDGGMNKETIPKAISAGANRIVSASAIFNRSDALVGAPTLRRSEKGVKKSIEELQNVVRRTN